ncbi:MAG: PAS domain-containing protein [Nitrospirae bacterium]|nr:PAS domain-containing protein [Nitrospirota bacterium]
MTKQHKAEQKKKNSINVNQPSILTDTALETKEAEIAFPIVGIGASAGGLEALEQFLSHVPKKSGAAFVIVQHLDPTHKGMMTELLQRCTTMKVTQVKDRMKIEPDCVYVIPPNRDMSILHGTLHLIEPVEPRGLRLPIDSFFRSLAEDMRHLSIGVILSGMGSDGTRGLAAIKEKAGLALVQEPSTARFDGMPRSAIDAGFADITASADSLPEKLMQYLNTAHSINRINPVIEGKTKSALEKAVILLRSKTGNDFSLYKKSTVYRRIERRMSIHQIDKIDVYIHYLQENPNELELLFKELLIGVTSFFRDPAAWDNLKTKLIPELISKRNSNYTLRAWIPGCSTGEEAYSLAMVFKEALEEVNPKKIFSFQIYATDLDRDAIEKARQGFFSANIATEVSSERLRRFFVKEENGYRVNREIREMVVFAPQNVIMDPPFTKLDILCCRNLLIYFTTELQKKLIPIFHYSLNPGGILFLGSAETIGSFTDMFVPCEGKDRLYKKKESAVGSNQIEFPTAFFPSTIDNNAKGIVHKPVENLQSLADQLLLQSFSPPAVLVTQQGDILYISGKTGKYLEPAAGKANWNIFAMAREGLRYHLAAAFKKALKQQELLKVRGVKLETEGRTQLVNLTLQVISEPESLKGMVMIVFEDASELTKTKRHSGSRKISDHEEAVEELKRQLQEARHELQSAREEMQSSQEELKSSNEEMQSTNEELQSTNEELTTSKEEMQSLNEELQTVNAELQAKIDELSRTSDDMKNLLNSTDIATLFLDNNLNVRRFTTQATNIIKLIPGDVGRPVTDIVSDLQYPTLPEDAREVLRTLVFTNKEVPATDGRWFAVRIMPYRTQESIIDGVVITFMEITTAKKLEAELRRANDQTSAA